MDPRTRLYGLVPDANIRALEIAQGCTDYQENPPGSNRGPELDALCRQFGYAPGLPWCALLVAKCWADAGLEVPPPPHDPFWAAHQLPVEYGPASAEAWRRWALITSRFASEPQEGAAVVYGVEGHAPASHLGILLRRAPMRETIEGNTAFGEYSREGVACSTKPLNVPRLIGYVWTQPRTSPTA